MPWLPAPPSTPDVTSHRVPNRGWAPLVWVNGQILPAEQAGVSVFDRGLLLGDGVYETLLVRHGRIFRWNLHRERLWRSFSMARMEVSLLPEALEEAVLACASANGMSDARVRLTVTRGEGGPGFDLAPGTPANAIIALSRVSPIPPDRLVAGAAAIVASIHQTGKDNLDPALKSISRIHLALARMEAQAAGAQEAILLGSDGILREGTASNVFMVRGGRILTPSLECGILAGVTRGAVLELAMQQGIGCEQGRFTRDDLQSAEEVFVTNTSWGALPVSRLDGRPVGSGRSGRIALQLAGAVSALVERECTP